METITIKNAEFFKHVSESLQKRQEVVIPCKGTSMLPFIRNAKDKVLLTPISKPKEELQKGDIILFKINDRYILHRFLSFNSKKSNPDMLIAEIMGDGILKNKEFCPMEHILGKVKYIYKKNRTIDPNSNYQRFLWRIWYIFKPFRRYLLGLYRRLF